MAFSFGNTGQSAFGGGAAKPAAFGSPFGVTPTTGTTTFGQSAFGTSSFGAPQSAPSAFGTSAFGSTAPTASVAPTFGGGTSTFGSTAPTFGTGGGATTGPFGTSTGAFGGGGSTLFGGGGSTLGKPQGGGLFGSTGATPSLFSSTGQSSGQQGGLFGASNTMTQATPSLFGGGGTTSTFGTPQVSSSSLFGNTGGGLFGTTNTTSGLFGAPTSTTQTQPSLFGTSTGAFGTGTQKTSTFGMQSGAFTTGSGGGLFGQGQSTFGATTTLSMAPKSTFGGLGGFGGTTITLGGGFQQQQQQQQQPQQLTYQQKEQQIMASIFAINIFGDERDAVLKKWNLLQACWGTGKGYYNASLPPVEYTPRNPFYRFKAAGYNLMPSFDNADGIVKLIFAKKMEELQGQKEVLVNGVTGLLGNRPNLKVVVQLLASVSETQCEVRIVVTEKGAAGTTRPIPANDLAAFLNLPAQKQQLANVGVVKIQAYVAPPKSIYEEYLRTPPPGFDPQMWSCAVADNPDPAHYMPVPIYGFSDLKERKIRQEHQARIHRGYVMRMDEELLELRKKQATSIARINELKVRFLHLQHKVLKIVVREETARKCGMPLIAEEEYLKGKLETLNAHLNTPTQFKGKLMELVASVRLMGNNPMPAEPKYRLNPECQADLKDFLQLQQHGIVKLVDVVKEDMRALNIISDGMRKIVQSRNGMP